MSNISLQNFNQNGIELMINTTTGESFASQSAIARMVSKDPSDGGLRNFLSKYLSESATIHTTKGLRSCQLYSEEVIYEVFAKYNIELLVQCAKAGIRVYLHKLAGYEVKSTAVQPETPQTYLAALKELVIKEEENIALRSQNTELVLKIEENAPKVALADSIAFSKSSIEFHAFAKIIGTGRTRLFQKMREAGVIMKTSNLPYQRWVDLGMFELSEEVCNGKIRPFALVTGKGQVWLKQRLDHCQSIEQKTIQGIVYGVLATL